LSKPSILKVKKCEEETKIEDIQTASNYGLTRSETLYPKQDSLIQLRTTLQKLSDSAIIQ
jgi:hypothetical protein